MRRNTPRAWAAAAVLALGVCAGAGPAFGADSPSPTAPASGSAAAASVLRIGMTTGIDNPNIWAVNSASEWEAVTLQYDMMLKFGDTDLTAAPSLATSCDPNTDSTVWTCHLRPGVKWSDGQPLTSRDVAFSYRFAIDKQFPYFSGYFPAGTTFSTPDDSTLVWTSKTPTNAPKVPAWAYVVPEHVWSTFAKADVKTITAANMLPNVVSGPYYMSSATPGQSWTFLRNPNFWGSRPAYDSVVFQLFTNQEAMVQALKNGQIDVADGLEGSLLPAASALPNVAVQKVTPDFWINMAFNFGGQGASSHPLPALRDLRVRKAIAMAVDKQAIVDKVYPGAAQVGDTIIRPLSTYWHLTVPDDKRMAFDPAAANALLDQAGYTMGADGVRVDPTTGQPLKMRLPVSDDTAGSTPVGQLVAGFLKKIGIAVTVQPVTAGKMYDIQQSGDYDAYIWYWSGDPDPNYQLSVFTSAACGDLSDGCWKDPTYDAMFAKQKAELDQAARQVIVKDMQQYVYDHVPNLVLAYPNALEAYRTDKVAGLVATPSGDGYLMPTYGYTSLVSAHPAGATTGEVPSTGLPTWAWAAIAAAVVALGVWLLRRTGRRGSEHDEMA